MKYEDFYDKYGDPLEISSDDTVEYLEDIFHFHFNNSPYWIKLRKKHNIDVELIFNGSFEDTIERIFNSNIPIGDNELRINWLEFLPRGYKGKIRFYQSSGTTGPKSFCHWDYEYVKALTKYLRYSLDRIYRLNDVYNESHQMRALLHGPYGWYQEEMSELVWSYGGVLYFIATETEGLKRVLEKEGIQGAMKFLEPLVKYSQRVLEKDKINLTRTAVQLLDIFVPYRENLEIIMLSGTRTTLDVLKKYQKEFEDSTFIPLYGHFAFGDAIGVYTEKEIRYYPNYPFTVILPLVPENGRYRIAKYGERGYTGIIIARPEILIVKIENELITRSPPKKPFRWDGFANPRREII